MKTDPVPPVATPVPGPARGLDPPAAQLVEQPKPSLLRRLAGLSGLLVLVALGGIVWWQQDHLKDWVVLRDYQPSAAIEKLSTDTTMTEYGRRLFYVNKPAVEEREAFNRHCSALAEHEAAVLGCFIGDRRGIYVYNVTDERLAGIQQVTAAHEMLHQAYTRLSAGERKKIDKWLTDYAATITDQQLKDKIDLYRQTEPNDVTNEMHSVFGTEVADLPADLEQYYKRYFTDRQQIVTFHQRYRAAFDERTAKIAEYDRQLAALREQIDAKRSDLTVREQSLRSQRAQLDSYLANNQISEYNAAVPGYNSQVVAYKQAVTDTNSLINQYNGLIDQRNTLTVEEQQLLKAQDSQAP